MTSPIELLTANPDRKQSFLFDKINPACCAVAGFACACFINWAMRKPPFAGIQQHILFTAGAGGAGLYFDRRRNEFLAERDAVLRHYIELHPEDFPTPERKKFAQVLERWVPIR